MYKLKEVLYNKEQYFLQFFLYCHCNVRIIKNDIIVKVGNKFCETWCFQLPKFGFCVVATVLLPIMNVCTLIPIKASN
jgi:hypothetical protein